MSERAKDDPVIRRFCGALVVAVAIATSGSPDANAQRREGNVAAAPGAGFLKTYCYDCHRGTEPEGGLDLTKLGGDLADESIVKRWVRIFDRVADGEMPPADAADLEPKDRDAFLKATGDWLRSFQRERDARLGRVRGRRLTRRELERSIQTLLGIDIPLADQLPEEAASAEFSTIADGQSMSHFQMERHLAVVDVALDEAFRRAFSPEDRYEREFSAEEVARQTNRRTREPEMREGRAVTWSSGLIFYGRVPATTAPEDGWYRFKVKAGGLKLPEHGGVWTTVRSGLCVSSAPLLAWVGSFEAGDEAKEMEFTAWLPKRHMLEIRPGDATIKKARFAGGQVGVGEGEPQDVPGVAIDRIVMQRIHLGPDDEGVRRLLFDDLQVQRSESRRQPWKLVSNAPKDDAARLLAAFARRAFRRPVTAAEIAGFVGMAHAALDDGADLKDALRVGYRAMLCSPRFLYLTETPGPLDDHAIAARLSYLLTGNTPDERLAQLADAGRLQNVGAIRSEVNRLLAGPGGRRFVQDFAAEWLDLDQIDFTEPDGKLYPGFDSIVQQSMLDETHTYLETMLRENQSVTRLIDSDETFLNSRLARFYDIRGVSGDELRRVKLKPEHHRGGVLTQGAILKVTANGSNTSPVVRGVWVSERLLGMPIPPPPDNVPAIEPDIRGAKTIRDMLAKHRSQESCASCHVKIDPPGFALENFDPAGRWRDRYLQLVGGRRDKGAPIDASYTLRDGRGFRDVNSFKQLIVAAPEALARNVAEKLLVYGTGAALSFADRQAVDNMVEQASGENYGFRSLIEAVATSPVFLSK
jgi:hypothetical protein